MATPRKRPEDKLKTGRPRKFTEPEIMQKKIDAYFAECDDHGEPYTIPGLAYALGFVDRQAVSHYETYPEFSPTIKRARLRIERQRNSGLVLGTGSAAGHIFDLKNNFGWKDKQEVEHSGNLTVKMDSEDEEL